MSLRKKFEEPVPENPEDLDEYRYQVSVYNEQNSLI